MTATLRVFGHLMLAAALTVVTQLGGVAWLLALAFRRRLFAFLAIYAALSLAALWVAPVFGRTAVSCLSDGPLRVASPVYCALNRTFVSDDLRAVLTEAAREIDRRHPGTYTLLLDANFPFFDGFPLLPHLSHDDGDKADLAFYYADETGYRPGIIRSPIGYFAFERGPTDCPAAWPSLRGDFGWLQHFWRGLSVDETRTGALIRHLSSDPRVGRIFLEPHLAARLDVQDPKVRFQGCRAARHEDHIHLQL